MTYIVKISLNCSILCNMLIEIPQTHNICTVIVENTAANPDIDFTYLTLCLGMFPPPL